MSVTQHVAVCIGYVLQEIGIGIRSCPTFYYSIDVLQNNHALSLLQDLTMNEGTELIMN